MTIQYMSVEPRMEEQWNLKHYIVDIVGQHFKRITAKRTIKKAQAKK